ncbi:hypothetical protein VOLCADRAFT_91154 [Volvox carteri f. nagariensis]|uniref:PH domain-containing protein n=1 Tax=Volvox carteri f. nagariensis TaxID=3068 RepID=D8TWB5_VOLCA|nr:uncharacterized protein VOLCADRAFT_91154 [Volvox carteri f. nagariensis]EFJ48126.1 hypothetical protein VOLCADRAFT_91154 [Volvox carteri f. nagariensis]|eukprot:XP_002950811.1 hypothetical protein VOLCADRAFT_91154 [Volvox carteri f. nagariensis]
MGGISSAIPSVMRRNDSFPGFPSRQLRTCAAALAVAISHQTYGEQLDCIHVSAALVRLAKIYRNNAAELTVPYAAALAEAEAAPPPLTAPVGSGGGAIRTKGSSSSGGGGGGRGARFARAWKRARGTGEALAAEGAETPMWLVTAEERRLRRSVAERHPGGMRRCTVLTALLPPPSALLPPTTGTVAAATALLPPTTGTVAAATALLPPTTGTVAAAVVDHVARLLDSLLVRIPGLMPRACCRTVSNMLWALGVLQPLAAPRPQWRRRGSGAAAVGVPRVAAAASTLAAKMRHFWREAGPHSLSLALWGLARLGLRPKPVWVAELEFASGRLLPRFSARELSCCLWALATLRVRPDALWLAAAQRSVTAALAAPDANLRCVATLLWSLAVLQVRLEGPTAAAITSALAVFLQAECGGGGSGDDAVPGLLPSICMSLWGLARLGLRPRSELLAEWRRAASGPLLAAAPARAVSCMLWSLSRLRCAPPAAWVDEAAAALLARALDGRLGCQSLCLAVAALAQLDSRISPEWLRAFSAAAAPLVRHLDPSELGVVLHGMGRLAVRCGGCNEALAAEFLAASDAAAAAALSTASADDVAGIGGGLANLGAARSVRLHDAFVRHTAGLVQLRALAPRHAAACLQYFVASSPRHGSVASAHAAAAASAGGGGGGAASAGRPDGPQTGPDSGRELWYDTVRARVPDDTKQPLPPPQPPPPPRKLVVALLMAVLTAPLDQYDVFDVGQALCAAAELGLKARTPAARSAVTAAAARVCGHAPGANGVLRLLQGMYGLRVRPRTTWLTRVASQIGCRLRSLTAVEELELLLRLLAALQWPSPAAAAAGAAHLAQQPPPPQQQQQPAAPGEELKGEDDSTLSSSSALLALLRAAQPALSSAPIQHLLQLAAALVAASTTRSTAAGAAAAAPAAAMAPSRTSPPPPAVARLEFPHGWMPAFEGATAGKLSQPCVTAASLVELLACFACFGHAPGPTWTAAWYDSTADRFRSLRPAHLCMALHLQRRLGLRPPLPWLRNHAAALMAAVVPSATEAPLPPLEVLAAVAELQRLGLDDASAPLSGMVATAATQLRAELVAAEPAAQLATLAALQAILDPGVAAPAPHAEGWAVGVLAMAHSVITQRPLHLFLAGLRRTAVAPPSLSGELDDAAGGGHGAAASPRSSEAIVTLLASMVRCGHVPDQRWMSGIVRHICRQAESIAAADGGDGDGASGSGGGWPAADVARAVCCLAALGYVPDAAVAERLQQLLQPVLAERDGLSPGLAAELCCAWASVRRRPPPSWWCAVEAGALAPAALAEVPQPALVRLPYSMKQLGHLPSYEWLACYLPHLSIALAAAAPPPPLAHSAAASTTRAADLANLAWALGSAVHDGGYPPDVLSSSAGLVGGGPGQGPPPSAPGLGDCFCGTSDKTASCMRRTAQLLPPLLRSQEAYRVDDLAWAVVKLDPRGAVAVPFLELLQRQRAAAVAAAAESSAWRRRAVACSGAADGASDAADVETHRSGGGGGGAAAATLRRTYVRRRRRGRLSKSLDNGTHGDIAAAAAAAAADIPADGGATPAGSLSPAEAEAVNDSGPAAAVRRVQRANVAPGTFDMYVCVLYFTMRQIYMSSGKGRGFDLFCAPATSISRAATFTSPLRAAGALAQLTRVALAAASSPVAHSALHTAAPGSPQSLTKQSDVSSSGGGGGAGGTDSGPSGHGSGAPYHTQHKYGKRSSDSGGVAGGGGVGLGFLVSLPPPKGASVSGAPAVAAASSTFHHHLPSHQQSAAQQQQQGTTGSQGSAGRRLQQLGQRLNFGLALGRKKHATFAPGLSGGGGGGGQQLSYPEDASGAGGNGGGGGGYATTALRLKRDGMPPASYMWLWLGNFKRWHRRYFVASEAPGKLLIYKRANMKGKVWSTSLRDAAVVQDDSHPRQIRLEAPSGAIFLRVLRPEERQPWIACLRESQEQYRKHKEVVDTLAAAAGGEGGEGGGADTQSLPPIHRHTISTPNLPNVSPPSPGAVEQDAEQRRRIRARLNDRLAELAPLVSEVERHLVLVGHHLAGAAAGIAHLTAPLTQFNSVTQLSGRGLRSPGPTAASASAVAAAGPEFYGAGHFPPAVITTTTTATAAVTSTAPPPPPPPHRAASPLVAGGGGGGGGDGAAAAAAAACHSAPAAAAAMGRPSAGGGGAGRRPETAAAAAAAAAAGGLLLPLTVSEADAMAGLPDRGAPSLAGAIAALVDAFRATLHNDAVRIATLEAENAALNKTLNILRANTHRNATRTRGVSTPGFNPNGPGGGGAAAPGGGAAAAAGSQGPARSSGSVPAVPMAGVTSASGTSAASGGPGGAGAGAGGAMTAAAVMNDVDAASEGGSACTADEDAFDVVEAFDDGVDYSILDDDAPHLHHRLGVDDYEPPYVQHGNYPGAADEEESDEDAEEDAAELAQQAEVLNALEVVRQVEYITAANDNNAQLKTLLTADSPPPPDAEEEEEEEEGGKAKHKSCGKGEVRVGPGEKTRRQGEGRGGEGKQGEEKQGEGRGDRTRMAAEEKVLRFHFYFSSCRAIPLALHPLVHSIPLPPP